jgi:DNA-binding NarL/FixJ family response regulator
MRSKTVSVFIVDDLAMLCEAVGSFLSADPDIQVLGSETDSTKAVGRLVELKPDVVLLDLKMPGKDGTAVLTEAKPQLANTHFLILCGEIDEDTALNMIRAGASGVVLKTVGAETIRKAVKCVANGELWLERHYLATVVRHLTRPRKDWEALSARELQIVEAVARGLSNREIGERLLISEDTVKSHLKVVFRKLNIGNRLDLAIRARSRGLGVNPESN